MSGSRVLIRVILLVAAFALHAKQASAGNCTGACSFTPIQPSTSCGSYATVPYKFRAIGTPTEPLDADWDLPDLNDPYSNGGTNPNYANALQHATHFVGNGWTFRARLHFQNFWVDPSDSVQFGGSTYTGLNLSPFYALWSAPTSPPTSTIHSQGAAIMTFTSDVAETPAAGFLVDSLGVCKRSTQTTVDTGNPVLMNSVFRFTGALLGPNDVVYLRVPPGISGAHWTYALWSEHSPYDATVDFDLYARCGAWPTPTNYTYRSYSGNTREFIHDSSSCATGMYLAIHSFNGSGVFHATWGKHFSSSERTIRVGTSFNAGILDIQEMESALQAAARRFYGQTEGNWIMKEIWLYNSNDCNNCGGQVCSLCMRPEQDRSFCTALCGPQFTPQCTIYRDADGETWHPQTIAHEWGHQYLCVDDEYVNTPPETLTQCGHSNMGNKGYSNYGINNFCTDLGHNQDPSGSAPPSVLPNVWDEGQGLFSNADLTFDNFHYHDHDFELKVGKVVRK